MIGVIGDVHAEAKFLDKTVAFLKSQNVDRIFCVGDIVDGSGDADECCNILRKAEISVVLGNHDRWFLNNELRDLKTATQPDSLINSQSIDPQLSIEEVDGIYRKVGAGF